MLYLFAYVAAIAIVFYFNYASATLNDRWDRSNGERRQHAR